MGKIFPELKKYPRFTSVGSYTLVYLIHFWEWHCGEEIGEFCASCADKFRIKKEYEGGGGMVIGKIEAVTFDEGPTKFCEECQEPIEASYGDPSEEVQCPD